MDYKEKYEKALERAVNLFVTNNISATAACEIFPELNKSEEVNYKKKYKEALERARVLMTNQNPPTFDKHLIEMVFPELQESEDERIRNFLIDFIKVCTWTEKKDQGWPSREDCLAWLEKQGEPEDKGEISDGYHTFNELYRYRMLYNAAFFNLLPKELVHKSKKHHDGEECFGGGWFIVMANLPTGQISNHYELKDWDLFKIPEKEVADEWDGHTPQEAADRLHRYLLEKQGEQKPTLPKWKYKKDHIPLLKDSLILNKYGCVGKSPSGAIVSDVWVLDYDELAKLPKEELEKQGKKKPADKVEPKFHEDDWIIATGEVVYQIKDIQGTNVTLVESNGDESIFDISVLDNAKLWTIADAKDGDVLVNGSNIFIFHFINGTRLMGYCHVNVDDNKFYIDNAFDTSFFDTSFGTIDAEFTVASKEQRDLLFQKMKEAGYEWDSDKKELKKIEPKKLDADKVIAWLVTNICHFDYYVKLFKKDFGL